MVYHCYLKYYEHLLVFLFYTNCYAKFSIFQQWCTMFNTLHIGETDFLLICLLIHLHKILMLGNVDNVESHYFMPKD